MAEISESFWRSLSEETGCSLPVSLEDEFRLVEGSSGGWNGLLDFILKQPIEGSTEVSESAENQSLIRSPSDLLWDSSRVVLSSTDPPTFINATHVSLPQIDRHYVLTQSPLLSTMSHFWSMVWQLQVRSVLMMNLFNEKISVDSVANQIHFYLPIGAENGDTDVKEFGDFVIRYETRESFPSFDLTRLQVTQKSTEFSRSITHYAFKSWTMDTEDVPLYTSRSDDLLEFVFQLYSRSVLDKVSLSLSPSPPVLVHCSDGLGRSAALALLDYCLQIVKRTNSTKGVKIPELVHELREQRRGAITAGDQLKTVYTCLLSGASKLLSHKPAVPLDTWESRESDDESVDLETQQTQILLIHNINNHDMFTLILCLLLPVGLCHNTYFRDVSGHNYDTFQMEHTSPRYKRQTPAVTQDHHLYYSREFYPEGKLDDVWIDLSLNHSPHSQLSNGYYMYYAVDLQFDFPFYGHYIQSVAITTHGFLSTADILHRNIHLTQYIAPFSADFNPSASHLSNIYYLSLPDLFVTQWSHLYLETNRSAGYFTFQVQLRPNGEILFAYKHIPLSVEGTSKKSFESFHGIADGFILNISSLLYLFSYHNVTLPDDVPLEGAVYILTPLENCITASSPEECNVTSCNTSFTCGWCESIQLCSDGYDRQRQNWFDSDCNNQADIYCEVPVIQSSSSGAVIAGVSILFLVLLFVPIISLVFAFLIVWRLLHYRRGGSFWVGGEQVAGDNQVAPEKSEHIILREADDAL